MCVWKAVLDEYLYPQGYFACSYALYIELQTELCYNVYLGVSVYILSWLYDAGLTPVNQADDEARTWRHNYDSKPRPTIEAMEVTDLRYKLHVVA